jgi:uncharacterized protein with von Willebrand factor type A (vWA) domain
MGRIVDLCGEIAEAAEEGGEGLVLPPDVWERLRGEWSEEDIEDCLGLVHESLLQGELVESADSLSARLIELLGAFAEEQAFRQAAAGSGVLSLEAIGQLTRRVARLEEILEAFRDNPPPDRRGFDALQRRLADHGIEDEMERGRAEEARGGLAVEHGEDDEDEE